LYKGDSIKMLSRVHLLHKELKIDFVSKVGLPRDWLYDTNHFLLWALLGG